MARRKLFSPRTKNRIRAALAGDRLSNRASSVPPCRRLGDEERRETVCVQVRGTLCVGVSQKLRTELWQSILNRPGIHQEARSNYDVLLQQEVPVSVRESIQKDVGRTFPDLKVFSSGSNERGRHAMMNVLTAYAAYDSEVAYCQGMNFLAGMLLLSLPAEEDAFAALVMLMHERGLRDLYTEDMSLLEVRLHQLTQLLPSPLVKHLESLGALPVLFASPWFLTCFAAHFPLQVAARIMDVILCDSFDAFMLKVSYSLVMSNKKYLLSTSSMEEVLEFLTSSLPNGQVEKLQDVITEALQVPWTNEQRSIIDNASQFESLYDTISRVEDALTSTETLSDSDEEVSRTKKCHMRRSFTTMAIPSPHTFISNLKLKPFMHLHVQSFIRKFR